MLKNCTSNKLNFRISIRVFQEEKAKILFVLHRIPNLIKVKKSSKNKILSQFLTNDIIHYNYQLF